MLQMSDRTNMNTFEEFSNIPSDTVLAFNDKYTTEEQKHRDTEVTKLLVAYVKTYENKIERNSHKPVSYTHLDVYKRQIKSFTFTRKTS